MSLALASATLGQRQVLAQGRFYQRLVERGIDAFEAQLRYSHAGGEGRFKTVLARRGGGWFALHLRPERDMPQLPDAGPVRLTLRLTRPGVPPLEAQLDVPGAALAVGPRALVVQGQELTTLRVAGAPFAFEIAVDPPPLLLDGLILRGNDPSDPVGGCIIRIAGLPDRTSAADGRFRVPELPFLPLVTLTFQDGPQTINRTLHPPWGTQRFNQSFSFPSP